MGCPMSRLCCETWESADLGPPARQRDRIVLDKGLVKWGAMSRLCCETWESADLGHPPRILSRRNSGVPTLSQRTRRDGPPPAQ